MEEEEEKPIITPFRIILALFLILIILLTLLPLSSVKLNPEPTDVPGLEIIPQITDVGLTHITSRQQINQLINKNDPVIKQLADRIVTTGCKSSKLCYSKALFYWVRDNFNYINDPYEFEYIKSARESLVSHGGDCDDASVLLANLEQAIGISTRFAFVPGHVYIEIYLPEAPARYTDEGWISLDPACKTCQFGELAFDTAKAVPQYI